MAWASEGREGRRRTETESDRDGGGEGVGLRRWLRRAQDAPPGLRRLGPDSSIGALSSPRAARAPTPRAEPHGRPLAGRGLAAGA